MPRAVPISLEELLAQKGGNSKATPNKAKPKFVSSRQRDKHFDEREEKVNSEKRQKRVLEDQEASQRLKKRRQMDDFLASTSKEDDMLDGYNPIVVATKKRGSRAEDEFEKHWSEKRLSEMKERDWRIMREDYDIRNKGAKMENPLRSWAESSKLIPELQEQLKRLRYNEPTPIQRASVPMGLANRDVIGIAETGSGKTLAYVLPLLNYVLKLPSIEDGTDGPYGLVLVPTRELALQVEEEFEKFYKNLRFRVASLIGGHSYDENIEKLQNGAEIVIATPGRLIDCLDKGILGLDRCYFLVMDEADRMVDMGFKDQLSQILSQLPAGETNPYYFGSSSSTPQRTTMMFTATMPEAIEKIAERHLVEPATVTIGEVGSAVDRITQNAMAAPQSEEKRLDMLRNVIERRNYRPTVIVFANYKKTCEEIGQYLEGLGFHPVVMHGSKSQEQREKAIEDLKRGRADILVATDVAGRGIDIPGVSLVVNYQMPKTIEDYTHRIGRTGRAGKRGTAVSFWDKDRDLEVLPDLRRMIEKSPSSRLPQDLREATQPN